MGYATSSSESSPSTPTPKPVITQISQKQSYGYELIITKPDITDKYLRLRPKHRRKSSVLFNYEIFKEYLTDVIDKREYFHGWVMGMGALDPGWFGYIDLYKGAVGKLRAQMV